MLTTLFLFATVTGLIHAAVKPPSFGPDFEPCVGCDNMNGEQVISLSFFSTTTTITIFTNQVVSLFFLFDDNKR